VNVENGGTIYLVLYDKEDKFMTKNYFRTAQLEVKENNNVVHFEDIPFGTYAVSTYHDINGNQQMDFNEMRMPVEDYAMSGTPNPMGYPTWNEVKFQFEEVAQEVNLQF
jgi:uncharacterized protein (DUF2141 family)